MIPSKGSKSNRTPYELQNRRNGGILIRQGQSWILLKRHEIKRLMRDLGQHLDDPRRVEESARIGKKE